MYWANRQTLVQLHRQQFSCRYRCVMLAAVNLALNCQLQADTHLFPTPQHLFFSHFSFSSLKPQPMPTQVVSGISNLSRLGTAFKTKKRQRATGKVSCIYPLSTEYVRTKLYDPSNSGWDISIWTILVDRPTNTAIPRATTLANNNLKSSPNHSQSVKMLLVTQKVITEC